MTLANKDKVDAAIHKYIGEQSSYGHCSVDWKKSSQRNKRKSEDAKGTH